MELSIRLVQTVHTHTPVFIHIPTTRFSPGGDLNNRQKRFVIPIWNTPPHPPHPAQHYYPPQSKPQQSQTPWPPPPEAPLLPPSAPRQGGGRCGGGLLAAGLGRGGGPGARARPGEAGAPAGPPRWPRGLRPGAEEGAAPLQSRRSGTLQTQREGSARAGGRESGRRRRYLERVGLAQVHVEGRAVGQDLAAAGHRAEDVGPHLGQLCHRGPHQLAGGRQVPHGDGRRSRGPPQPPATPPGCRRRHVAVSCSAPPLPAAAANSHRRC